MQTQIKKIDHIDDFINATIEINGVEFQVTAPGSNPADWCGDSNWVVTEKNAERLGVTEDELLDTVNQLMTAI